MDLKELTSIYAKAVESAEPPVKIEAMKILVLSLIADQMYTLNELLGKIAEEERKFHNDLLAELPVAGRGM